MRNEAEQLAVQWGIPLALALLAVGARLLMSTDRLTLIGILRGVVVGLFVGCLVNLYLSDIPTLGEGTKGALVGAAAVLAEDIVVLVIKIGRYFRDRPETLIEFVVNILSRGTKK